MRKSFYRSVWISDVHLSNWDAQSEALYRFLDSIKCDHLYLVGDIIDVWSLRRKWHWPKQYNEVIHKLLKRSRKGAKVVFIPGNHDEFFRSFVGVQFGDVEIKAQDIHTTADGRRFLVTHGDEFDAVIRGYPWLGHLGTWAQRHLVTLNRIINAMRRCVGMREWSLAQSIKRRVNETVKVINKFEDVVIAAAKREGVDGVICGHIHRPALYEEDGIVYCNTGDWVENCTALVEHTDGRLELIRWLEAERLQKAFESADQVSQDTIPVSARRSLRSKIINRTPVGVWRSSEITWSSRPKTG